MYEYQAEVVEVHDGDSCTLSLDLGVHVHIKPFVVRLAHYNAPELHEAGGAASHTRFTDLLARGPLTVRTTRDRTEKYGRWLAEIDNADGVNVGDQMFAEGLVAKYEGGRR